MPNGAEGTTIEANLQACADRLAILQALACYSRGVDRLDVATVQSVYWEDSFDDHGPFQGSGWEMAVWAVELLERKYEATTHFLGQSFIDLRGAQAGVETAFVAYNKLRERPKLTMIGGRYADLFEKRQGEWRILRRTVIYDWNAESDAQRPLDYPHTAGVRDHSDVSYAVLSRQQE